MTVTASSSTITPPGQLDGQDRLTQLHDFLDTLDGQTAGYAENWFLGALASLTSNSAWSAALDTIKTTFAPHDVAGVRR